MYTHVHRSHAYTCVHTCTGTCTHHTTVTHTAHVCTHHQGHASHIHACTHHTVHIPHDTQFTHIHTCPHTTHVHTCAQRHTRPPLAGSCLKSTRCPPAGRLGPVNAAAHEVLNQNRIVDSVSRLPSLTATYRDSLKALRHELAPSGRTRTLWEAREAGRGPHPCSLGSGGPLAQSTRGEPRHPGLVCFVPRGLLLSYCVFADTALVFNLSSEAWNLIFLSFLYF